MNEYFNENIPLRVVVDDSFTVIIKHKRKKKKRKNSNLKHPSIQKLRLRPFPRGQGMLKYLMNK